MAIRKTQKQILEMLSVSGPMTRKEIHERLGRSAANGMRSLEANGLIRSFRTANENPEAKWARFTVLKFEFVAWPPASTSRRAKRADEGRFSEVVAEVRNARVAGMTYKAICAAIAAQASSMMREIEHPTPTASLPRPPELAAEAMREAIAAVGGK